MRSYEAARRLFSFLAFLAWCVIFSGGFVAFVAGGVAAEMKGFGRPPAELAIAIAATPGLAMSFLGFLGLAAVQNGRASVDTAELTQQMLKVARDQLEVSQQALQRSNSTAQSFGAVAATSEKEGGAGYRGARTSEQSEAPDGNQRPALDASEVTRGVGGLLTYNGQSIAEAGGAYLVDGMPFASLEAAKTYINENPPRKP